MPKPRLLESQGKGNRLGPTNLVKSKPNPENINTQDFLKMHLNLIAKKHDFEVQHATSLLLYKSGK